MGRIKELREKVAKQEATDEEKTELEELEAEAAGEAEKPDDETGDEEEEKAITRLADKIASAAFGKVESKVDDVLKAIEKPEEKIEITSPNLIVDKALGKVSPDKLDEIKIELPGRKVKGKEFTSVTGKTLHFLHALFTGDKEKIQVLSEGTGSLGGFLVPEEFANILVEDRRDMTVMRKLATAVNVNTDSFHVPILDSRPKAFWRSEGAVKSTSTAQFSEITLTPYSLATIVSLTNELVADATLGVNGSLIATIARLMSQSLSEEEDKAFWTGSGSGRPTGVNTYTYQTVAGGFTDTVKADAIQKAVYRLPQGYRNGAAWVAHRAVWEKVAILKDSNNQYLLRNLLEGTSPTLKGYPTYEQNDLEQNVMFFGDFSYYWIADREGIEVKASDEATVASRSAFERNLVHVRAEERVDGEMTLTGAVVELTNM